MQPAGVAGVGPHQGLRRATEEDRAAAPREDGFNHPVLSDGADRYSQGVHLVILLEPGSVRE